VAPGSFQQFRIFNIPDGFGGEALCHVGKVGEQLPESNIGRLFTEIVQNLQELAVDFGFITSGIRQ
jgi:hypothetical protein